MRLFFNRKVLSRSKRQTAARLKVEELEKRNTPGALPAGLLASSGEITPTFARNGAVPPAHGDLDSAVPFLNGVFLPPAAFVTAPASLSGVATDSTVTDSTVG